MNLYYWIANLTLIDSVLLVGFFGATLVRILRGSRLTNVSIMTGLLLLANIFYAASTVPLYTQLQAETTGDLDKASICVIWYYALTAVAMVFFFESHWLLAMHYWKAAKNTPKVLRKEKVVPTATQTVVYWIGIAVSAIAPLVQGYFDAKFDWRLLNKIPTNDINIMNSVSFAVMNLVLIVIGVISIVSVILINRYMKTLPDTQRISIKALLIHAGAFGLFLVSTLIFTIAWILNHQNEDTQTMQNIAEIVFIVLSFISQCCICQVFWQLGEKDVEYPEVQVAPFDEDAEIQTRIWNQFVRVALPTITYEKINASDDQDKTIVATVTYSDIVASKVNPSNSARLPETHRLTMVNE